MSDNTYYRMSFQQPISETTIGHPQRPRVCLACRDELTQRGHGEFYICSACYHTLSDGILKAEFKSKKDQE
ncbi:hypothetical protein ACH42_17215 [Endozoicomonas sp. (ex Bugula neritina AB1)]|nr:hypothetical protein ACH42_17215 [Endozoicomonas sp. (ex Bugula neritina AB1)]